MYQFLENDLSITGILEVTAPDENHTEYEISKLEITIKSEIIVNLQDRFIYDNIEFTLHTRWTPKSELYDWNFSPNTLVLNLTMANAPTLNSLWQWNIFEGGYELSDPDADNIYFGIRLKDNVESEADAFPSVILNPILV